MFVPSDFKDLQSDFLRILAQRGFLYDCTDLGGLDRRLCTPGQRGYIGFDATADSLHAGSLIQLMMLRWFQKTGHTPIVLLGGGTTKVGDPSGKDEARKLLDSGQIAHNTEALKKQITRFVDGGPVIYVDNADWLDRLGYLEVLREIGTHFTVNRMLGFDAVRTRLERESPLSFLEFNYMILQSYDFLNLAQKHACCFQIGGSDQWGNIVSGVELIRRLLNQAVYGLTSPLLTRASGEKMGKTAGGAIWLSAERLSPFDFWQYWRDMDDRDVEKFLWLFTELEPEEVRRLGRLEGAERNLAKKRLAHEVTCLVHGRAQAEQAEKAAAQLFSDETAGAAKTAVPVVRLAQEAAGLSVVELCVLARLVDSQSEARRLIRQGGLALNGVRVEAETYRLSERDLAADRSLELRRGKKKFARVVFSST